MLQAKVCLLPAVGLVWLSCFHVCAHAAENLAAPASYEQLIVDLQTRPQNSDVAMQLGEAYFGLGRSLQERERHAEALLAFDDALQLLRENRGLYELAQVPVLQARLDSSQALAAWRDVDAGRQLAYLIALKNPDAGSERRYQTLRELGLWKLRAAEEELLPNALDEVRDAATLYQQELERPGLRAAYAERPLALANLYLDLAALEFLQARKKLALPLGAYVVGGQRSVAQVFLRNDSDARRQNAPGLPHAAGAEPGLLHGLV